MEKLSHSEVAETHGGNNAVKAITAMVFLAILGSGVLVCTGKPAKQSCKVDDKTIKQAKSETRSLIQKTQPNQYPLPENTHIVRIPVDISTLQRNPLLPDRLITFPYPLDKRLRTPFDATETNFDALGNPFVGNTYDLGQNMFNDKVVEIISQCEKEAREKAMPRYGIITEESLDEELSFKEKCLIEKTKRNCTDFAARSMFQDMIHIYGDMQYMKFPSEERTQLDSMYQRRLKVCTDNTSLQIKRQ